MLLEDFQVILKVAEFRSITAAATNLDMRTATASAAVKRVEASLGVELFVRTTRHLRLSSAGERYLPQCEEALKMLEKAKMNMREELGIIDGEIRIALSSDLGRNVVTPWLDEFLLDYPDVSLRSGISDSNIDFYRDSVDMALRYGSPTDASMYGFKICDVPRLLCASPEYLAKYGTPSEPDDLLEHNALFYQLHDILQNEWLFNDGKEDIKVKLKGNRASNDGDLVRRWCVAGKGVAIKSCLDMADDLLTGKVVNVMADYKPTSTELWLICPSRQSITPTVRLLRDMLREKTEQILIQMKDKGILLG
ncbi:MULTISPECIES: LysR family transcriptional regulator [Vibrio]|uniref:LysR family transcriptional regulator n=1 Tax=Vibrio TaxID=662 RepID=UPI000C83DC2C|nr:MULTISPECIES: LysR family transcriptional regulator [Vibrio]PMF93695.1 LysR family transcriptional regulator [Vibrio breoganii]PMG98498.1 LysR family transcriptional regulator [Vibrio breoganii]PMH16957.1 LysR family transcriptional regulator [Vibrio breoganii]PMH30848.1 LysR family transcriptional regulator [Vibrio sp. 10N.286.49.C2]PMH50882.1 LysR family transcriptional regulator [Vibrio sp. 10N.286.49.B1]